MLTHNQLNWGLLMVGALTAVGTIGLAMATFWMAKKTRDLAVQEERHHQDGAMPICLLDEEVRGRSNTVELREQGKGSQIPFEYHIYGALRNIGHGPALNIRLVLRFPTFNNHEITYDLDPLGAGEARGADLTAAIASVCNPEAPPYEKQFAAREGRRIATIPMAPVGNFNDTTIRMSGDAWGDIFLEYTDIFGTRFYTQHTKDPQNQWMRLGKGSRPAPIAVPAIHSEHMSVMSMSGRNNERREY